MEGEKEGSNTQAKHAKLSLDAHEKYSKNNIEL